MTVSSTARHCPLHYLCETLDAARVDRSVLAGEWCHNPR